MSMIAQSGLPLSSTARVPTRKRATSSIGFCVADKPIRCSGGFVSAAKRSILSARCAPRRSSTTAWISSTISVRTLLNMPRPESEVSNRYKDSGVVTRMCGGFLMSAWRCAAVVSPVRTSARTSISRPSVSCNDARIPASGS